MGRGKGIPIEIKQKIAKHFVENGFNKRSKREAREIFEKMSNSERFFSQ